MSQVVRRREPQPEFRWKRVHGNECTFNIKFRRHNCNRQHLGVGSNSAPKFIRVVFLFVRELLQYLAHEFLSRYIQVFCLYVTMSE